MNTQLQKPHSSFAGGLSPSVLTARQLNGLNALNELNAPNDCNRDYFFPEREKGSRFPKTYFTAPIQIQSPGTLSQPNQRPRPHSFSKNESTFGAKVKVLDSFQIKTVPKTRETIRARPPFLFTPSPQAERVGVRLGLGADEKGCKDADY